MALDDGCTAKESLEGCGVCSNQVLFTACVHALSELAMPVGRWTEAALTKAILYTAALLLCSMPVVSARCFPYATGVEVCSIGFDLHTFEHFSGGLLGVKANVALDRRNRRAHIELRGAVFAGSVSGVARFASNSAADALASDSVLIEEPLKSALSRRFVSISEAHHDPSRDEVVVTARFPMGIGKHRIVLRRADAC